MAFVLQLKRLKREVQQQLDDLKNPSSEKNRHASNPQSSSASTSDKSDLESNKPDEPADDAPQDENGPSDNDSHREDRYTLIPGIERKEKDDGSIYYLVGPTSPTDPQLGRNWSTRRRMKTTILLVSIGFVATAASSIDSAVIAPASKAFGVSEVVEALGGTGMFLIGFGVGALVCAPLSELVGRYPTYLGALSLFAIWLMASALSPNIGAQIVFRAFAGFCSSAPLTVAGGSMADIWTPRELTWSFSIFAFAGFGGPVTGPVIGAWIGQPGTIDWRWADWIMLIADGFVLFLVIAFKEETLQLQLTKYKAHYFRKLTGDDRFMSSAEVDSKGLGQHLWQSFSRPFILGTEPIIIAFTLYLTIIYIVLFTFLDGYAYIFERTYGISSGLTYTIFVAMFVGIVSPALFLPLVYRITMKQLKRDGDDGTGSKLRRELRLIWAMMGAPCIPIGLFWMAWTDYASISIWSPIISSVIIGFGILTIFLSAYMYMIDCYTVYAASALVFATLVRYVAAGGMTVVGVPFYQNMGTHYTLTILACISAAAVPIPYALFKWGPKIRERSKYAVG